MTELGIRHKIQRRVGVIGTRCIVGVKVRLPGGINPVGDIGQLSWVFGNIRMNHPVHRGDCQIFSACRQSEIRVQVPTFVKSRVGQVLARCKDHKMPLGGNRDSIGKRPLTKLLGVVGEIQPAQAHCYVTGIMDLDPVGINLIAITTTGSGSNPSTQRRTIARHEFSDQESRSFFRPESTRRVSPGGAGEIRRAHAVEIVTFCRKPLESKREGALFKTDLNLLLPGCWIGTAIRCPVKQFDEGLVVTRIRHSSSYFCRCRRYQSLRFVNDDRNGN